MRNQQELCRFCLKICDSNFEVVEELTKEILDVLLLKINLEISAEPVMCKNCAAVLYKSFDFKLTCFSIQNSTVLSVNHKENMELDLREIYLSKMGKETDVGIPGDHTICELCMGLFKNCRFTSLDISEQDKLFKKLGKCLPELDFRIISKPVICTYCDESLQNYFNFMMKCSIVEETIIAYCSAQGVNNNGPVNLNNVLQCTSENMLTDRDDGNDVYTIKREEPFEKNESAFEVKNENFMEIEDHDILMEIEEQQVLAFDNEIIDIKAEKHEINRMEKPTTSVPHSGLNDLALFFIGSPFKYFNLEYVKKQLITAGIRLPSNISKQISMIICTEEAYNTSKAVRGGVKKKIKVVQERYAMEILKSIVPNLLAYPVGYPGSCQAVSRDRELIVTDNQEIRVQGQSLLTAAYNRLRASKPFPKILNNKVTFLTGTLGKVFKSYEHAVKFIQSCGGKRERKNITKAIDYLVCGENPSEFYLKKANKIPKIKKFTEEEFITYIEKKHERKMYYLGLTKKAAATAAELSQEEEEEKEEEGGYWEEEHVEENEMTKIEKEKDKEEGMAAVAALEAEINSSSSNKSSNSSINERYVMMAANLLADKAAEFQKAILHKTGWTINTTEKYLKEVIKQIFINSFEKRDGSNCCHLDERPENLLAQDDDDHADHDAATAAPALIVKRQVIEMKRRGSRRWRRDRMKVIERNEKGKMRSNARREIRRKLQK